MQSSNSRATAVLCSGGLDSAVLLAQEARSGLVLPVYVRVGLAWEEAEQAAVAALLAWPTLADRVQPLTTLDIPMHDVYPAAHWALVGRPPAYDTPDSDVYLVGRNLILLAKAAVLCAERGVSRIVLGLLADNPFPDATRPFLVAMERALSLGLAHPIVIDTPLTDRHKADVVRRGADLGVPFELTLSCMNPRARLHCGLCSKCRERRDGFHAAGVPDPTKYAAAAPR